MAARALFCPPCFGLADSGAADQCGALGRDGLTLLERLKVDCGFRMLPQVPVDPVRKRGCGRALARHSDQPTSS